MIFVGAQSIYTRAILANEKYGFMIFFLVGALGGTCPPGPPVATPLALNGPRNRFNIGLHYEETP